MNERKMSFPFKAENAYQTEDLGHLGLVAGMCNELKIAETIDTLLPSSGKQISHGTAVCAMILNGLGFVNQRLYLTPHFFEKKPVERLLGEGIKAEQLNDASLGRTLDAIYQYGPSALYSQVAAQSALILNLNPRFGHLDSTSKHVHGIYNSNEIVEEGVIQLTQGYSRDHHPELNQFVINMIVESRASIPMFMNTASGNSNDKSDFREIINRHIKQLKNDTSIEYVIADSALYVKKTLIDISSQVFWLSRVPETIKGVPELFKNVDLNSFQEINKNYRFLEIGGFYGGIPQRWFVIHSTHAYQREIHTLNRNYLKGSQKEQKSFDKLCHQEFACQEDAQKTLNIFENKLKFTSLHQIEFVAKSYYSKRGKPKKGDIPTKTVWFIDGCVASDLTKRSPMESSKGFFILATNEMDSKKLDAEEVFWAYKDQQKVERGFRFLKTTEFLASSVFLKKPERIMALAMIMTLCLMVYAALEYRIRQQLSDTNQTFPNQLGQEIQNPTSRWIFHCFVGIHVLRIQEKQPIVLNMNEQHRKIVQLLGYQHYYS